MEYLAEGTLFQRLHDSSPISDQQVCEWAEGMAKGLRFLHYRGLVHGDLDSHNVLVSQFALFCL
jgi:serine/threonine protein kinase